MTLSSALICLDCETIHEQATCPACGSGCCFLLSKWLAPIEEPKPAVDAHLGAVSE